MLIHVMYREKKYDYINASRLDDMIKARQIAKFQRRSGWVTPGIDPVRVKERQRTYICVEENSGKESL